LAVAADVLDVGVQLVADPDVQRQVRPQAPVVLNEERDVVVVAVVEQEVLIRLAAAERDREQQVVVVDAAVAVVIERGEVLDHLEAALLEYAEIERAADPLPL